MKVLVCRGRNYNDEKFLNRVLDNFHKERKIDLIIEGGAKGADTLAGLWAEKNQVPLSVYKADWKKHGLSAGYLRNKRMLDFEEPDVVVAFPGGEGTYWYLQCITAWPWTSLSHPGNRGHRPDKGMESAEKEGV